MNIFKKLYFRTYQTFFRIMIPLLPYREPKILKDIEGVFEVLKEKKIGKFLLVTDKSIRDLGLTQMLEKMAQEKGIEFAVYDETVPNPTTQNVEDALKLYNENACQALIAFGGGSVMDCAKAVGARVARPNKPLSKMKGVMKVFKKIPLLIAVPTTAGTGSETTLAAVITDSETRNKYAINDFPLIPKYALLDANLTVGLPKHITATTGMDALTHAIEAYIGRSTTKRTRENALYAVKTIIKNLQNVYENGENLAGRQNMLLASYNAGLAFTKSYVGYVHALSHAVSGKYNVPHGLANAVILPYVLKKFAPKIYKQLWSLGVYAELFDVQTPKEVGAKLFIEKIEEMNEKMGIPTTISEIEDRDIPHLAITAEKEANPLYPVPVIFEAEQLEEIYREVRNG